MSAFSLLFALLPLIVVFTMIIVQKKPADLAGGLGWLTAFLIALFYYNTPVSVLLTAGLSGVVASLPIGIAMGAATFQIFFMAETGAMERVVDYIKSVAPTDKCIQMLLINCGIGIMFTSFGAVTISIFPPILLALGYTTFAAIALPCIGYTGGCIYAIMGVPLLIFANFAGVELRDAGLLFAQFLPILLTIVAFASLWIAGGWTSLKQGFLPAIIAGVVAGLTALPVAYFGGVPLTGIIVGLAYILVLLLILRLRGQPIIAKADPNLPPKTYRLGMMAAISPWLVLVVLSIIVNLPFFPVFDLLFKEWAMPLEIIPGRPEKLRIFWQSYFWIPVATLICVPLLKGNKASLSAAWQKTMSRAPRPILAIAIFFSIASLYTYSGFSSDWTLTNPANNMFGALSGFAAEALGQAYIVAAPFLGLFVGVISGSQSGSIAMLTKLHLGVGEHIGISGVTLALLSALAGGLSGAISPAKVMNAASVIGKVGEEGAVLRSIIGITMILTAIISLLALVWPW